MCEAQRTYIWRGLAVGDAAFGQVEGERRLGIPEPHMALLAHRATQGLGYGLRWGGEEN